MGRPLRDRERLRSHILSSVSISDGGCWEWQRGYSQGYGVIGSWWLRDQIGTTREIFKVYEAMYFLDVGEKPEGAHLHHTCENKACCNPEHLVALSPRDHKRAHYGDKCPGDHEPRWRLNRSGHRLCMECERIRGLRRRARAGANRRVFRSEYAA